MPPSPPPRLIFSSREKEPWYEARGEGESRYNVVTHPSPPPPAHTHTHLFHSYMPPLLWGRSGHLQTIVFGIIGRFSVPVVPRKRHNIVLQDGSTLSYDVFGGEGSGTNSSYTFIVCPGIT